MPSNNTSSTAVSTHIFAPDNSGFTCTKKDQFTYFKGTGSRERFGLTFADVEEKTRLFITSYKQTGCPERIIDLLAKLEHDMMLVKSTPILSNNDIANFVINTGHIPIVLSHISAARDYSKAARSIHSQEVSNFFGHVPEAAAQALIYTAKQRLMQLIKDFRADLCTERTRIENTEQQTLLLLNRMIIDLDRQVIFENQRSLPNYEQFDLSQTFFDKIGALVCKLDAKHQAFINDVFKSLNEIPGQFQKTVEAQRELSKAVYSRLKDHIEHTIGLPLGENNDDESQQEMTEEQDSMLLDVMPILVYLNAPTNPFARNGLVGRIATDAVYEEALNAYVDHESRERFPSMAYVYRYDPSSNIHYTYTDEQIDALLFGVEATCRNGTGFFAGLLSSQPRRHGQLEIPAAPQHLAITAGPVSATSPSANTAVFK